MSPLEIVIKAKEIHFTRKAIKPIFEVVVDEDYLRSCSYLINRSTLIFVTSWIDLFTRCMCDDFLSGSIVLGG